jgi:hypothetical protein
MLTFPVLRKEKEKFEVKCDEKRRTNSEPLRKQQYSLQNGKAEAGALIITAECST